MLKLAARICNVCKEQFEPKERFHTLCPKCHIPSKTFTAKSSKGGRTAKVTKRFNKSKGKLLSILQNPRG